MHAMEETKRTINDVKLWLKRRGTNDIRVKAMNLQMEN